MSQEHHRGYAHPQLAGRRSVVRHPVVIVTIYLVAWYALDVLALQFETAPEVRIWYPPAALDVVLLLVFGLRYWPALLLNTLVHTLLVTQRALSLDTLLVFDLVTTLGYVSACALLLHVLRINPRLYTLRDVAWFVIIAAIAAPLLIALLLSVNFAWSGLIAWSRLSIHTLESWAGDGTGISMLAPPLLILLRRVPWLWAHPDPTPPAGRRTWRWPTPRTIPLFVAEIAFVGFGVWLAYDFRIEGEIDHKYFMFVPLIWLAVRHGFERTVLGVLLMNCGAALIVWSDEQQMHGLGLQFGLMAMTQVGVLLGAFITDRQHAAAVLSESEARFRLLAENMRDIVCLHEPDGRYSYISPSQERLLGHPPEALVGSNAYDLIHPDDQPHILAAHERALAGEESTRVEYRLRRRAGDYVWVETLTQPIRDATNSITHLQTTSRDITERKRVEAALTHSEARYRDIFEKDLSANSITTPDGRLLACNPAFLRMFGFASTEEARQRNLTELYPDAAARRVVVQLIKQRKHLDRHEATMRHRDGAPIYVVMNVVGVFDEHNELLEMQNHLFDITERKQAEEALRESEARFRAAFDHAGVGSGLVPPDGRWAQVNRALCEIVGYDEQTLHTMTWMDITYPEDLAPSMRSWQQLLAGEIDYYHLEKRYIHRQGHPVWILLDCSLVRDSTGKPLYAISQMQDISERKQAELALQDERSFVSAVLDTAGALVSVLDAEGRLLRFNRACERITGYTFAEVEGRSIYDFLVPPEQVAQVKTFLQSITPGAPPSEGENHWITKHGQWRLISWANTAITDLTDTNTYMIGVGIDITERRQAEEHMRASLHEKEVLLQEIHHRVKNNLQIISSLLRMQSSYTKLPQALELFRESQNRVKSMALVHEKLYRSQNLAHIDFAEYIRSLTATLFHSYNASTTTFAVEADSLFLDIDTAIPCGLIVNELVSNALKHAFPGGRSGTMRIAFRRAPNAHCALTVGDNGVGLPAGLDVHNTETLGLQLVSTLTAQLDGTLAVSRDNGTVWTLHFPSHHAEKG